MTFKFTLLKKYNSKLSNEKIIKVLKDYDRNFFNSWLKFNDRINSNISVENWIINLPAMEVDKIGVKLKAFK